MDKKSWQLHHGFTDSDMVIIEMVLKMFKGRIVGF